MVQKYQNEISPILYYGISTKNNEKDVKIPNLQPPNWKSPYWMTLYYIYRRVYGVYVDVDIIRYNIYRQCRYVMVIVSCRLPPGWLSYSFTQLHTSWPRSLVTNLATRVTSFRHELEKGNKVFLFEFWIYRFFTNYWVILPHMVRWNGEIQIFQKPLVWF